VAESVKLRRLRELREKIARGALSSDEKKATMVNDTDGTSVRLTDPGILAALDRRIAAEEGRA
jgi:hypothetical protein